jgi:hypothetical protein
MIGVILLAGQLAACRGADFDLGSPPKYIVYCNSCMMQYKLMAEEIFF